MVMKKWFCKIIKMTITLTFYLNEFFFFFFWLRKKTLKFIKIHACPPDKQQNNGLEHHPSKQKNPWHDMHEVD